MSDTSTENGSRFLPASLISERIQILDGARGIEEKLFAAATLMGVANLLALTELRDRAIAAHVYAQAVGRINTHDVRRGPFQDAYRYGEHLALRAYQASLDTHSPNA